MRQEKKFFEGSSQGQSNMVLCQLVPNGITSKPLIEAFDSTPREIFIPAGKKAIAYQDMTISLRDGRYMLSPLVLGKLFQIAEIHPTDKILVVGFTTGYSLAIARCLTNKVHGLENNVDWIEEAQERLNAISVLPVSLAISPLSECHPTERDFDVILIEGAIPFIPDAIIQSLSPHGRLVCILEEHQGDSGSVGRGMVLRKNELSIDHLHNQEFWFLASKKLVSNRNVHKVLEGCEPIFNDVQGAKGEGYTSGLIIQLSKFDAQVPPLPNFQQKKGFIL